MKKIWRVPLIIRGEVIDEGVVEFGGRRGGATFTTPEVGKHLEQLALDRPSRMADLYSLSFDDIAEYLGRLGERLNLDTNPHMQQARAFHILNLLENAYKFDNVMAVERTEITDIHSLEHILLMGNRRLQ